MIHNYKLVFHEANKTKHNVFRYVSDASAIDWWLRRVILGGNKNNVQL